MANRRMANTNRTYATGTILMFARWAVFPPKIWAQAPNYKQKQCDNIVSPEFVKFPFYLAFWEFGFRLISKARQSRAETDCASCVSPDKNKN